MDAGLGSVSAKDASDLVGGSNAVMVDARTGDMHTALCRLEQCFTVAMELEAAPPC